MKCYSASIDIAATPSQVFTALTDPEIVKQWQPEAVDAKPPEGGLRVGATVRVSVKEYGRQFSVEFVVEALEPDARLAYHMTTPMWSARIEYVLTPRHGGTKVSFVLLPDQLKLVVRVLAMLTRPLLQRRFRSRLAALRRVVEANV